MAIFYMETIFQRYSFPRELLTYTSCLSVSSEGLNCCRKKMIEEKMTTDEKVIRAEDILQNVPNVIDSKNMDNSDSTSNNVKTKKTKSLQQDIPRGKPKSGRIWKEQKQRFSSIVKTRGIRLRLEHKRKIKEDLKRAKEMTKAIKAEKEAQKEAKKERRRKNLKKAQENERKSEVVQVITNTAKLRKIKKKHLRMIQKRDTLNL